MIFAPNWDIVGCHHDRHNIISWASPYEWHSPMALIAKAVFDKIKSPWFENITYRDNNLTKIKYDHSRSLARRAWDNRFTSGYIGYCNHTGSEKWA